MTAKRLESSTEYYIEDGILYDRRDNLPLGRQDKETGKVDVITVEVVERMIDEYERHSGERVSFDDMATVLIENAREAAQTESATTEIIGNDKIEMQLISGRPPAEQPSDWQELPKPLARKDIPSEPLAATLILYKPLSGGRVSTEAFTSSFVRRNGNSLEVQPNDAEVERFERAYKDHRLAIFPPIDEGINTLANMRMAIYARMQLDALQETEGSA